MKKPTKKQLLEAAKKVRYAATLPNAITLLKSFIELLEGPKASTKRKRRT